MRETDQMTGTSGRWLERLVGRLAERLPLRLIEIVMKTVTETSINTRAAAMKLSWSWNLLRNYGETVTGDM